MLRNRCLILLTRLASFHVRMSLLGLIEIDVIHVKAMTLSIPHYSTMVERLAVILRPGGQLVLVEEDPAYVSGTLVALHLIELLNV